MCLCVCDGVVKIGVKVPFVPPLFETISQEMLSEVGVAAPHMCMWLSCVHV